MHNPDHSGPAAPDEFPGLLAAVQRRFAAHAEGPLFFTAATGLWPIFLDNIPQQLRQHYTCSACRHFVERFGALVAIDEAGRLSSALWGEAPAEFARAFASLAEAVVAAELHGVLVPASRVLGTPSSPATAEGKVWSHFSVEVPTVHSHALLSAGQVQAERKEDWRMLSRGLAEFPLPLVERAHTLLSSGTLYRSEKCIGVATWLLGLHRSLAAVKTSRQRDALIWRAAATAPAGFAHVRSSMIGTLLEDLAGGLDSAAIKRRFDEKMAPTQYARAQVAPSAGNIAQAEKVIAGLKASGALARRYARLADLTSFLWRPRAAQPAQPGSVFGHLTPRTPTSPGKLALPQQTMTWEKFARTVLPDAVGIEAQVPAVSERFMALVTAVSADAPPILQWDAEERRNPTSWYYHAGIDAEMKRRVEGAGGQYEGVDIRASLLWDNRNDLDLHVITPRGEHIYFGSKRSNCGGWLDVDMNVRGETTTPVENIRWARGAAPRGHYRIYVQNYRFHEPGRQPTPFKVEVEISGEIYHFTGVVSPRQETGAASDYTVFEFDHEPGHRLTHPPRHAVPQPQGTGQWNVAAGAWVAVTAIVASPNLWGERPLEQHGRHTFFLLKGCRDTTAGLGRGFFTETLRGDFHAIRATLEAFNRSATIAGADEAEACGLGMTDQKPWNLALRVTTANAVATYLIDRWD
jgi:hypothetical protein